MAVTPTAFSTSAGDDQSNVTDLTLAAVTVSAGTGRAIWVLIGQENAGSAPPAIDSVTSDVDGALEEVIDQTYQPGDGDRHMHIYRLMDATVGDHVIFIDLAGSTKWITAFAVAVTGNNLTTPNRTPEAASGAPTSPLTDAITTGTGELVLSQAFGFDADLNADVGTQLGPLVVDDDWVHDALHHSGASPLTVSFSGESPFGILSVSLLPEAAAGASGTIAATLAALTSAAQARLEANGDVASTMPALTSAGTARLVHRGDVAATLPALTSASDGGLAFRAGVTAGLPAMTADASGTTESDNVSGDVASSLPAMTAAAEGTAAQPEPDRVRLLTGFPRTAVVVDAWGSPELGGSPYKTEDGQHKVDLVEELDTTPENPQKARLNTHKATIEPAITDEDSTLRYKSRSGTNRAEEV